MQKAKYEVERVGGNIVYKAITTTRGTAEMVDILNGLFGGRNFPYRIVKTVGGEKEVVFNKIKPIGNNKKSIPILDTYTEIVHPSATICSKETGCSRTTIYKSINATFKKGRFIKYSPPKKEKEETYS